MDVLISFFTPFFLLFSFITSQLLHYIRTIAILVSFVIPTTIITLVHHLSLPIYIYNTYNFSPVFLPLCVFSMRGNTSGNWCISHNVRIYCNAFLLYYSLLFLLNYQFIYDNKSASPSSWKQTSGNFYQDPTGSSAHANVMLVYWWAGGVEPEPPGPTPGNNGKSMPLWFFMRRII